VDSIYYTDPALVVKAFLTQVGGAMGKKMFLSFMMLLLIATGCGDGCGENLVDPEVQEFVTLFEDDYGVTVDYEVRIVDEELTDKPNVLATCKTSTKNGNVVKIERSFWDDNVYRRRKALVYHELGHCSFNLEHNDALIYVAIPTNAGPYVTEEGPESLMHSRLFSDRYWLLSFFKFHYIPQLRAEIENQSEIHVVDEGEYFCGGI